MKKSVPSFVLMGLLMILSGNTIAQTTASFGPYTYTVGSNTYQVKTKFTTQSWGETYLVLSLTNTGTAAIDMGGGSEVWFTANATPTIINFPSLGGLAYPETNTTSISTIQRGNANLIQTKLGFPPDTWANKLLAANQSFEIQYSLGSSVNASDYGTISQGVQLYANAWNRPNLYVPLTVNLPGTNSQLASVSILDKATSVTATQSITTGMSINVFSGDDLAIWGSDFIAGNTLYTSTYTKQNPLQINSGTTASTVTLPYTSSVIASGTMTIAITGLPTGASTKLTLTGTTYPLSKEVVIANGNTTIPSLPYDTYAVSVGRYANESANTVAVPTYPTSYGFSGSNVGTLTVSFSTAGIKPFGVDGWPKYLAMGSITINQPDDDAGLAKTPLNAIFKYSGSGLGDTGQLLDDTAPTFPTTGTILQARRLEDKYASLYPSVPVPTVMPVMVHYTAQASGGGIGEADVYDDNNLKIHYQNLIRETKKLLSYKDDKHPYPGTFILSPDLLGAQQQSYTPNNFNDNEIYNHVIHVNEQVAAAFQAEGLPTGSLPVFTENWLGYYQSINYLIKTIGQGAIKYGWQINVWATGTALWVYSQSNQAQAQALSISSFVKDKLGVFSGSWKPDFVVMDRYEADCFSVRGQNYAYNAQAWDRFVEFSGAIGKNLNLPVMLWQIPGGHLATNKETIVKYDLQNHSSASGTYFLGDANVGIGTSKVRPEVLSLPLLPNNSVYNTTSTTVGDWLNQVPNYDYSKSQLQKLADNNIFSILWGGGETIAVAPLANNNGKNNNGNDDGWLANKLLNYYQNERVYQQQTITTPTLAITSPGDNTSLTTGSSVTITISLVNASATKVDFYNGTTLLGTASVAPFTYTLTNITAGNYAITAKATTTTGELTSNVIHLTVTAPTCTAAPVVSLATPVVSGSAPASITLTATASVSCGAITKIEFYTGTNLVGSSTVAPYSLNWANVSAGTYSLTAKAYANNTATTSAPVSVTVSAGSTTDLCANVADWNTATTYASDGLKVKYQGRLFTSMYWTKGDIPATPYVSGAPWKDLGACTGSCSVAPTVTLVQPSVSGTAPATVSLSATTSVSCGVINNVEFYNGATLLGSSSTAPYTVNWTNVAAGIYSLTAKVYANNTSTTSAPVSLTVNANPTNICAGVADWNTATTYASEGMKVMYQGHLYTSMYWTTGNTPTTPYVSGAPWKDLGVCSSGSGRISADGEETRKFVRIYPNPAHELLHVEFFLNDDNTEVQFDIVDLNGRLIHASRERFPKGNQETTLHLTNLSAQLYILRVTTKGSQLIGTQTFIYQK